MHDFHTAIIGAGSGGITVAVGLGGFGKKVALIEKKHVGGDCTNVGCVPSKTLIHLASHMHQSGLSPAEILAKVREHRDALREHETEEVQNIENVSFFAGEATFVDKNSLELTLDDGSVKRLSADNIVIATGSTPLRIPIDGLPEEKALTNENLFDLENLPEHLVVVGGGVIGCEMAFAFNRLGSRVTVVDLAPRLLGPLEPEVSDLIKRRCDGAGIAVLLNAKAARFDATTSTLILDQEGKEVKVDSVDKILLAIGRKPQLDLGLEKVGLIEHGLKTNAWGRTVVDTIYAIGDVNPSSAFTHSANAQGRRLVQKLALPFVPVGTEPAYPSATFTRPEVSQVGPVLADLHKQYHPNLIKSYRVDLKDTDRGYTQFFDQEDGFVLIHAMRLTGKVLSATIVADSASEMIGLLTHAVNSGVTMYKLSNLVFPYPTLSEAIKKAASSFTFETLPKLPQEALAFLQYRWGSARQAAENKPTPATG